MCSRPPSEKWRRFRNIRPSHAKRFICYALTRLYILYSTVGRSIASISDLGGIFTSVLCVSVNMALQSYISAMDLHIVLYIIHIYTLMAPFSLCWCRWYISHIHHFAGGISNINTTLRNDQFSASFLSERPPDPPGLWSITWEGPERVSPTKLRHTQEECQFPSSGYLYAQETPCFHLCSLFLACVSTD